MSNIQVHTHIHKHIFIPLRHTAWGEFARSNVNSIFNFLKTARLSSQVAELLTFLLTTYRYSNVPSSSRHLLFLSLIIAQFCLIEGAVHWLLVSLSYYFLFAHFDLFGFKVWEIYFTYLLALDIKAWDSLHARQSLTTGLHPKSFYFVLGNKSH